MNIVEKKLNEIHPYENNPRDNDNAVDAVANSIKEFGFKVPLVIDKDGIIVAGHTRYKAATKLGLKTVPCLIADDLTPEQIKAFRIAENKTGELASWDMEQLKKELISLNESDVNMTDFGFGDFELELITEDYAPTTTDDNFLTSYIENSENYLPNKYLTITYTNETEDQLRDFFNLKEDIKVTYRLEELLEVKL